MKRIFVDNDNGSTSQPFWMPWGIGGLIWRYLLFLICLVAYMLLLCWLGGIRFGSPFSDDNAEYFERYGDAVEYQVPQDDPYVREFIDDEFNGADPIGSRRNIDNPSPNLPDRDDNRLYNVPDDEIITNPDDNKKQIVATRLNVILNSDATDETYNTFANHFKALYPSDQYFINYYNALTKMMQLTVPASERRAIKENLPSQIPEIDFKVFYEEIFENMAGPSDHNDPAFSDSKQSWPFAPIQAYDAWGITEGSPDVVVAVIDSYIDVTHPELAGRIVKPYSVDRQSANVLPPQGVAYSFEDPEAGPIYHGTHVAATAVGAIDNAQGSAGIAPKASLMPISVGEQITSMKLIDATLYAIYQGADVVNISIASYFPEGTDEISLSEQVEYIMQEAREQQEVWDYIFDLANQRNCMIVWAAGNCNVLSGLDETKRNNTTLRVSAVDPSLNKADFSNYGKYDRYNLNYSDVSAPGYDIYSAGPANNYGFCSGTSMAAPIVTGAVALMKSLNPTLTNSEIISILKETGKPLPTEQHIGNLIQIRDALSAVSGQTANFDAIIENHDEIIGTWETTEERTVTTTDGVPTGDMCHIFLIFNTPTSGRIQYREDNGNVYSAPFSARFENDKLYIDQNGHATAPGQSDSYIESHLVCERGQNGTLVSYNTRDPQSRFYFIRRS